MYKNHYIAVFLGYLDVKDNEMYSRAPKFVIYEQKEFNKEKKKLTKLSSAQSTVPPSSGKCLKYFPFLLPPLGDYLEY